MVLVEHSFVTTTSAAADVQAIAAYLGQCGFSLLRTSAVDLEATQRAPDLRPRGVWLDPDLHVHVLCDRGRVDLAVMIREYERWPPAHTVLLVTLLEAIEAHVRSGTQSPAPWHTARAAAVQAAGLACDRRWLTRTLLIAVPWLVAIAVVAVLASRPP